MPFDYARDDVRRRLTITTTGNLTREEMLSVLERQADEGTWSYSVLYLAQDVTSFPRADDMRMLVSRVASLAASHGRRGPVAIVDARPTAYGMWRMYEALAEDLPLRLKICRDVDEAETWLSAQDG